MLKAFIVDDEIKAVDLLQFYIDKIDFLQLVGQSRNPAKAFSYLQKNQVDVLFLDINMPLLSGVELYKSLHHSPAVIFTTAYPEYAIEGFDLEAIDYLLKPISFPRFLKATERLLKRQQSRSESNDNTANAFTDLAYVKSGGIIHKISWRDIRFLEKDENYVIYHMNNKRILSRQTLSDLEKAFPSYICRTHKSYAVSLLHLEQIQRKSLFIDGRELPIGRTYKNELLNKIAKQNLSK